MTYFLGIDIGTGSTKGVALNESTSEIMSTEQVAYPTLHPNSHYSEQVPELIWQAFIKCVVRLVNKLGHGPEAIGFSSAMHSVIAIDDRGIPLTNIITWADGRSAAIADKIRHSKTAKEIYEATGTPIHAMSPLCKIAWFRENEPNVFNNASKFVSIKEYIWHKLFGDFEIDHSAASGTGLFDILKLEWYAPSLRLAGIRDHQLSSPVPTDYCRTDVSETLRNQLSLSSETKFIIGGGDGCLANLGSNAISGGIACLTIGTSGAIRIASETPCYDFERMTFNYILDDKTFICGGPINNGGAVLKWFLNDLLGKPLMSPRDYAGPLYEMGKVSPGAEGLIFLPYLMGERAPIWNSMASGAFFGITMQHRQEHFGKAVIEGISFALYHVAMALEAAAGKINHINASGGFVHSKEWLRILSDIFNRTIHCNNHEDASAIGAALIAIKASRNLSQYPVFADQENPEVFVPDPEKHSRYLRAFELYKKLYEKVKDEMETLYEFHLESGREKSN
jgi:gluconokinase